MYSSFEGVDTTVVAILFSNKLNLHLYSQIKDEQGHYILVKDHLEALNTKPRFIFTCYLGT
ncbi:unnamed protein product, partial [Menidia menidia]